MILEGFPVGPMAANCYIIGCPETKEAAVVDPGAEGGRILRRLDQLDLKCRYIILTHGHVDHIGALSQVKEGTGAEVLIHREDGEMLTSPARNLSLYAGLAVSHSPADRFLEDGDVIPLGKLSIKVIHTPGHTPGSICLEVGDCLITGDTLFAGSVGRSDFPGGSHQQLISSIKEKLLVYPPETKVLPGHGPASTIGEEARYNPFLTDRWY